MFASELADRDRATEARLVAAVDALLTGEAWDHLTLDGELGDEEATLALTEAVTAVLSPSVPSPAPQPSAEPAQESHVDDQIERLLRSLEAGAPPELIAPRLRRLTSAGRGPRGDAQV